MRIAKPQIAVVLCLLLLGAGCSGGGGSKEEGGSASTSESGLNDIAAADRDDLVDGGDVTWPLETFPANFNLHHVDGSLADGAAIMSALLPGTFNYDAAAQPVVNADLLESAVLTATEPKQIVTYKINPEAKWDDGNPITVADFEAQWKALNGKDKHYLVSSTEGYEKVETVAQGANDREVVVTFASPYVDWQKLFGILYPASTNRDPAVFNDGWVKTPLTTAGPFKLVSVDNTAKTVTLDRNPRWWGKRAKLNAIIFRFIDRDAQPDALANGEIDFMGIGSDVNRLKRVQGMPGVGLHRSSQPTFNHMTISGVSPILSDLTVRKAFAKAIDRDTIAKTLLGPLGVKTAPLGNHIYMTTQKGYVDNSSAVSFDLEAAGKLLDEAGWKLEGGTRVKDGKPLTLRLPLTSGSTVGKLISDLVFNMAQKVGIKIDIQAAPGDDFFKQYVNPGNFDIVLFGWQGGAFPVTSAKSIYVQPTKRPDGTDDIQQNYARIGSPEIDRLFDEAASTFDPQKQIEIGNQIDKLIWEEVHSLTFYQVPDIVASKEKLANFGAFGFASRIYEDIGYKK